MTTAVGHISDLHILDLAGTGWPRFLNKRITGLATLAGSRRGAHPLAIADRLGDALRDAGCAHVLITGDLTNLALPSEFARARRVVEAIGDPSFVTLIPGNHDTYTRGALRESRFEHVFSDYLTRPDGVVVRSRADWPMYADIAPHIRVYGLSSAIPTPPIISWGELGDRQLDRLRELVATEPATVTTRIVLVHHNLHPRGKNKDRTAQLRDAPALARTLRAIDATVLLHGHTHTPNQWHLTHGDTPVFVLGCGSSTWGGPRHPDTARFNVLHVGDDGLQGASAYRWSDAQVAFVPERDDLLDSARAHPLSL